MSGLLEKLYTCKSFLAEGRFACEVDSDSHGGLVFSFWLHRCSRGVPPASPPSLFCQTTPSCQPPPSGSSFITLTWETQRDFFHPRALMFSLPESPRCVVLFTRYFVAAILSPDVSFFSPPPLPALISTSTIPQYSSTFYSLFVVFLPCRLAFVQPVG